MSEEVLLNLLLFGTLIRSLDWERDCSLTRRKALRDWDLDLSTRADLSPLLDSSSSSPRPKMLSWILSLKQPDGSFLVHKGGEVDVRASYCVICITLLLGICTPQVVEGMGDFIAG